MPPCDRTKQQIPSPNPSSHQTWGRVQMTQYALFSIPSLTDNPNSGFCLFSSLLCLICTLKHSSHSTSFPTSLVICLWFPLVHSHLSRLSFCHLYSISTDFDLTIFTDAVSLEPLKHTSQFSHFVPSSFRTRLKGEHQNTAENITANIGNKSVLSPKNPKFVFWNVSLYRRHRFLWILLASHNRLCTWWMLLPIIITCEEKCRSNVDAQISSFLPIQRVMFPLDLFNCCYSFSDDTSFHLRQAPKDGRWIAAMCAYLFGLGTIFHFHTQIRDCISTSPLQTLFALLNLKRASFIFIVTVSSRFWSNMSMLCHWSRLSNAKDTQGICGTIVMNNNYCIIAYDQQVHTLLQSYSDKPFQIQCRQSFD